MVVNGDLHPHPKRRRIDDSRATPSSIAESNKTLQKLLSNRQNRWMAAGSNVEWQTGTGPAPATHSSAGHANATAATPNAEVSQQARASTSVAPSSDASRGTSTGLQQERPHSQPTSTAEFVPPQEAASLVQYETGPLVQYETAPLAANGLDQVAQPNGRKSVDAMIRQQQPSLPSPAPSDDSPTLSTRARPQGSRTRHSTDAVPGIQPLPMASPPVATHQQNPSQRPVLRHSSAPGHPPPMTAPLQAGYQQMVNGQGFFLQQQQNYNHGQPSQRHSISVQPQPLQGPNRHVRTPSIVPSNAPPTRQLQASRVPQQTLLHQLATKEAEMKHAGHLSQTDSGRIALLREAVQKGDWFYQVLSQLFCLRSSSPMLLPQSLADVNKKCWDYLDMLICPNDNLHPDLINFFASFPEPLMAIYSDKADAREVYEGRVSAVKACLNKLPIHWDKLVEICKNMLAPPLVQDLHDTLSLRTPVLQSTAFRAIARMLYGNGDLDYKGVQAIESLHTIDQETFYSRAHRRDPLEKKTAYGVLSGVFTSWKTHLQSHAMESPFPDFPPPPFAAEFFKQPPQSILLQQMQPQWPPPPPQQWQIIQHQRPSSHHVLQQHLQNHVQAPNGRSSPILPQQRQIPPQPTQQAAFGRQLQAGHGGQQSHADPRQVRKLLFPRAEDQPRSQPTHPDWTRSGLHQTHLRSPDLGAKEHNAVAPRLYRHVVGFLVSPTRLKKGIPLQTFTFSMSQEAMDRIPGVGAIRTGGKAPSQRIEETSLLYRLRCSILPRGGFVSESAWVTADNSWPEDMYLELNGNKLETRRKLHHGRCLPIDLTPFIRIGENRVKVSRTRNKGDYRSHECAVAVEVIGVKSHENIKKSIPHIPADESLSTIKKSLGGPDDGDDDLAVSSSTLTIKLFDPYSGCRMVDVPVRGSSCLHRDCFDLETFLQMCKRKHPGWPSVVDCWRCPLCRGDVRPQTLVVDDFLVNVRRDLEKRGLLETRAIIVDSDGSWKPKAEEKTGVRSASLEREERRSIPRPSKTPAHPIEVIEID